VPWLPCGSGLEGKEVLTLAPTGGTPGKVGFGHRGVSCGWTICPAPGHSAVARKGGLAMAFAHGGACGRRLLSRTGTDGSSERGMS
jgi:hypothetical protein